MNKVLIFANYPQGEAIKDGMAQRIFAVDAEFADWHRTYVRLGFRQYLKKEHDTAAEGRIDIYRLNLFLHVFFLYRLIRQHRNIYIHSIYNYFMVSLFSLKGHRVTLDLHGAVPEEEAFRGSRFFSRVLSLAERKVFRVAQTFVCVSEEMRDFYMDKYPYCKEKTFVIKPIYSQNALVVVDSAAVSKLGNELGIRDTDTVFIYSGNTQKWQNVDLAIDTMIANARPNYFHILLTGEPDVVEQMISERKSGAAFRYVVRSVAPSELCAYYSLAHYGYILRDCHVLNRVAAPTKLIEYLYYGMVPIVKYERIGDALKLGYEYVGYQADLSDLPPRKSSKNIEVAKLLASRNAGTDLSKTFLS